MLCELAWQDFPSFIGGAPRTPGGNSVYMYLKGPSLAKSLPMGMSSHQNTSVHHLGFLTMTFFFNLGTFATIQ